MKFITVDQFKKADVKVQQAILEWWKPSVGDLIVSINDGNQYCVVDNFVEAINCCSLNLYNTINYTATKDEVIPLLTEGQLREFIENITKSTVLPESMFNPKNYSIICFKNEREYKYLFDNLGDDLLQALWQVANKIIQTNN